MSLQNELAPVSGGDDDPHAHESGQGRGHDQKKTGSMPRLRSPLEISAAIDQVTGLVSMGLLKESRAKVILQGLRMQLECTQVVGKESAGGTMMDVDGTVEFFNDNPEALRVIAPTIDPAALQEILHRLHTGNR